MISSALTRLPSEVSLDRVSLSNDAKAAVTGLILEWNYRRLIARSRHRSPVEAVFLRAAGMRKKSDGKGGLATELGLPLFLVRFDAVIGAYLGQTAIHLRQLFHFAETTS